MRETLYVCSECKMGFKDKKWADKCQKWCSEYHTCNLEIIKHAVKD